MTGLDPVSIFFARVFSKMDGYAGLRRAEGASE
jgi:hypothetical protein